MENDDVQRGAGENAVVIAMAVGDNDGVSGDLMSNGIRFAIIDGAMGQIANLH